MSIEALWYSSYVDGKAPHCTRYSRLPMWRQWELIIDLAISLAGGKAGWRTVWMNRTRESYWYWPHPLSASGWWMIQWRNDQRARTLVRDATTQALHGRGECDPADIVRVLQGWKRTGHWRKHISHIIPQRELLSRPVIPRWRSPRKRKVTHNG